MKRDELINRLVARKMNTADRTKGCVPCFGRAACFSRGQQPAPANQKK